MPAKPRVCLCMIVKNEEHVIARAITSALPIVDGICVIDTGSTDQTIQVMRQAAAQTDIVWEQDVAWEGFGKARTRALELAEDRGYDYALMLDADDYLVIEPGFEWPKYDMDAFMLQIRFGGLQYDRLQVFKLSSDWYYEGAVHEHPELKNAGSYCYETLKGIRLVASHEGSRSKDPLKWEKDAELLTKELKTCDKKWVSRNTFYLGQSWRNAGNDLWARSAYLERAMMGGWGEEVYCAKIEAARCKERLGEDPVEEYLRAWEYAQHRAEPLYELGRYWNKLGMENSARVILEKAKTIPKPISGLFICADVYDELINKELSKT